MTEKQLDNDETLRILKDKCNSLEYKLKNMEEKISRLERSSHSSLHESDKNDQDSRKTE